VTKRGPTDATLRNVQAANKRFEKLEKRMDDLEEIVRLAVIAMKAETPEPEPKLGRVIELLEAILERMPPD